MCLNFIANAYAFARPESPMSHCSPTLHFHMEATTCNAVRERNEIGFRHFLQNLKGVFFLFVIPENVVKLENDDINCGINILIQAMCSVTKLFVRLSFLKRQS